MDPTPTTTNEGAAGPLFGFSPSPAKPCEALPPSNRVNPPGIGKIRPPQGPLRGKPAQRLPREEGGAAQRAKPAACGRMRDAELVPTRAPLCVVAEEGVTGEKPHRKGFSSRACFCLLFSREKSRSGYGGETPETPGTGAEPPKSGVGPSGPTWRNRTCFAIY